MNIVQSLVNEMIENASLVHVKLTSRKKTNVFRTLFMAESVCSPVTTAPLTIQLVNERWNVKVGVPVGWVGHPQSNKHTPKGPDELELLPAKREEPDIYKKFYQRQRAGKEIRGC